MKDLKKYPLFTALVTPFNEDESVDYESLAKLIKMQDEAGNGILILGSTGENLALSSDEKKEIIEFTAKQNVSVPVMSGVGGTNFKESIEWINYLSTQPVDVYLLVTPLYTKPGEKGQIEWFTGLMDTAEKPCVLYNIPSRAGKPLDHNAVRTLKSHKNFFGIKEASGSIEEFLQYREDAPDGFLYSGDDGLTPFFAACGAQGLISVVSNVWPEETNLYTKKCLALELNGIMPAWQNISDALFVASNPIPAKAILRHKGIINTAKLRLPLTHKDLKSIEPLTEADKEIQNWFEKNKEK